MFHLRCSRHLSINTAAALLLVCTVLATTATAQFARKPATSRQNLRQFERLPEAQLHRKAPAAGNADAVGKDAANAQQQQQQQRSHSRSKRMIWITDDGRLALPPGTVLSISPTISLPLVRYPPSGFLSNMTMSFPLTIDFDKLGLTDNENPLGVLPPVFGRSMGRSLGHAAGSMLSNYVGQYLGVRRKRDTTGKQQEAPTNDNDNDDAEQDDEELDMLPESHRHVFHGGERAILYGVVEDMIATFGFNGKACMLRAICEMHSRTVHQYGLFGEMAKLFFTASKSKYSDMLPEYVQAEKIGEGSSGPGECFPYFKDCPRSIFKTNAKNRYTSDEPTSSTKRTTPSDDEDVERSADVDGAEQAVHLQDNEINDINGMAERYSM